MTQLNSLESIRDKREAISFITSQMVSCKEFGDKLHFLLRESLDILRIKEIKDLMIFLNRYIKHIFSSEHLYLWVADGVSFIFVGVDLIWIYLGNGNFLHLQFSRPRDKMSSHGRYLPRLY